ncbi:MAG: glycosyl transferase, partial [Bacilli bacterium]|nr:glycosyl transferase [Bacilli bacterium]
ISGDRPIITVEINDIRDMGFIRDILKAFEYYKNKSIFVDVVIINNELGQFSELVEKEIDDEMYRIYTLNSFYNTPGEVLVLDGSNITKEDQNLLDVVSRLKFTINNHISLEEAVFNLQSYNKVNDYPVYKEEVNIKLDNKDKLLFDNGYGGFSKDGKEYIIYNKDTPTPWSNIITNKNFGTIVTNNGCGYTYAYNSGEFKITSWTNDIVSNDKSEGFKFNDSLFDPEKCTHGFGYSILESETKELKHKVTEFVAVEDNVKIYLMKLKNKTFGDYNANVEFWINPVFGNFEEKTSRHILSEFMGQDNYLKLRNVYHNSYNNVNVFMSASEKINSAICDKMLVKSVTVNTSLKPGEEKSLVFVLGCSLSDEENLKLMKKYTDIKTSEKELKNVKEYWDNKLGNIKVSTPDNSFNTVMNGWYLYQTLSSRIMAKAGFYQISGAFGYRDQLQDAMNISMVEPEYTREQILNNASHQFVEGDVLHWWLEKNRFGLRSKYKDDYLWLVYATCNYINTTGDYKILDEKVPYVIGEALSEKENERGIIFSYSEEKVTLLEHCLKSLDISMNSLGVHKIPLMGGGDWNDGMNKVGIEGKGESVWLGFFLYSVIDLFVDIMKKYNKKFSVDKYITFNSKLKDNLNRNTWDGEYYLRAFFDNGNTLGSKNNKECKIDLISQSFSILSNVIPKDRVSKVINSVEEELVDNNNDIVKLLTPAFAKSTNNPGYIMNYPRGIRENGGQYTHAVSWYLMALIKEGYYNRAYEYYQMINPINRTIESKDVDKYKVEPYVIAADIYSSDKYIGRGGWTWYTGSAGWFYKVGIEDILGIKIRDKKLVIDPNIPDDWKEYKATYKYYNSTYNIHIKRSNKNGILFDGKKQNDNYIDLVDDNKTHDIELYL